jgi:anaerobic selenocysteine-containing dehydrogenase
MTDDKTSSAGDLLGQGEPGRPAVGRGPNMGGEFSQEAYHHPAAGWGAAPSVAKVLVDSRELIAGTRAIQRMNHENGGFDCPGCAWPDDTKGLHLDICENGIKHVTWEMTRKRVDREFFNGHTVSELSEWTDFALEDQGRLTEPMAYDGESDKYVPISWSGAFELVGATLRGWTARIRRRSTHPAGSATRRPFSISCG